jgi:hypothetical protein
VAFVGFVAFGARAKDACPQGRRKRKTAVHTFKKQRQGEDGASSGRSITAKLIDKMYSICSKMSSGNRL